MEVMKFKNGPKAYQIFQQENGYAHVEFSGTYIDFRTPEIPDELYREVPKLYISVVDENSSEPVIWWTECKVSDGEWKVELDIPAGGLYSICTSMTYKKDMDWSEWGIAGERIQHIGVGDIYVIAGQSNSAGYGKDFIYDPPELGVHIYKNNKTWDIATHPLQDSTGAGDNPNRDRGNTGHSMYLSFAKFLKRDLHYPIGLIQTSQGGSRMTWWNPERDGHLYNNMKQCIEDIGGKFKAIIWYQGCSEAAYQDRCDVFEQEFDEMHNAICRDFGKDTPMITFQISHFNDGTGYELDALWGRTREMQRQFAKKYKNLYVIPTTDCTMSDHGHISSVSLLRFGELAAKMVLHHLFGKNYMCEAPNLKTIRRVNGKTFELEFENVYDKFETRVSAKNLAIKAEDNGKIISAESYELVDKKNIRLTFANELSEDAVFHGGYTKEKEGVLPFDYATHLPIISFYGIKAE